MKKVYPVLFIVLLPFILIANNLDKRFLSSTIEAGDRSVITADFTADQTTIVQGDIIQFTDLSTGSPTSWQWDFDNDGVIDSTTQSPTWTYAEPGLFTVKLTTMVTLFF